VQTQLPEGAEVATQFMPSTVSGYNADLQAYEYDPDKAEQLLKEAGADNLTLKFAYPTEVSRPYMPDPKSVFAAFKTDLEAVGIKVTESSKPWNGGYLDGVEAQKPDLFLLGWTGDYNTPDNFIGTFFTRTPNGRERAKEFIARLADTAARAPAAASSCRWRRLSRGRRAGRAT